MIENGLYEEFYGAVGNTDELFRFAVKYELFEMVEFLYVHKTVPYNIDIFDEFYTTIVSEVNSDKVAVETTGCHTSLQISKIDKYTKNRNMCINYLLNLRKYSIYKYADNKHVYKFNSKYISSI
jgi:hypothetical protein